MAITVEQLPDKWSPTWNNLIAIVDSNNVAKEGFKYVVDVYSGNTSNLLARLRLPKHPTTNKGIVNLKEVLNAFNQGELSLNATSSGFTIAPHTYQVYRLEFGEQTTYWEFDDNFYTLSGFSEYVSFSSSTQQHSFQVGDEIRIIQDTGYSYQEYEGRTYVAGVPDDYSIVTSTNWAGSSPTNPGKAAFYNGDYVVVASLEVDEVRFAYNAAFDHIDFIDYQPNDWIVNPTSTASHLTNAPDTFRMREDQPAWLYCSSSGDSSTYRMVITAYTESGSVNGEYYVDNAYELSNQIYEERFLFVPVGIGQLNNYNSGNATANVGSFPILTDDVAYIRFQIKNNAAAAKTNIQRIDVDRRCANAEVKTLVFLDQKGSYFSFPFVLKHQEDWTIKRNVYNKSFGKFNGSSWVTETKDRGYDVFSTAINKEFTVISDWLKLAESRYMMELLASPSVFEWDTTNRRLIPVVINNGTYSYQNDTSEILRYTVKYTYSFGTNTQS